MPEAFQNYFSSTTPVSLRLQTSIIRFVLFKLNIFFLLGKLKEDILRPEVVETVKYLTSDAFRLDESKRPKNDVPLQTFRKLNV